MRWMNGWMIDGWMTFRFYFLFNSITVISDQDDVGRGVDNKGFVQWNPVYS